MLHTLLQKPAPWLGGNGPYPEYVLYSTGRLVRNLADLPFPARCNGDELRVSEERILAAFDRGGLMNRGRYCPLHSLDPREIRFLAERGLPVPTVDAEGGPLDHRGVFLADDQSYAITVNGPDHLAVQAFSGGGHLEPLWNRLNQVDEALAPSLDYAFDERLGYLSSAVGALGTGLQLRSVTHAAALTLHNGVEALRQVLWQDKNEMRAAGTESMVGGASADMYAVGNTATLGRAEAEIVFHANHALSTVIAREKQARERWRSEALRGFEDRVGRALGIAQGARLLEAAEAGWVLSSIRLGVVSGMLDGIALSQLNELHFALQPAHLEIEEGRDCDDLTLSAKRADLFRGRFA